MSDYSEYDIDDAVKDILENGDGIDTALRKLAGAPPTRRSIMSPKSQQQHVESSSELSHSILYLLIGLDQGCVLAESTDLKKLVKVAQVYGSGVALVYRNGGDMVPSNQSKAVTIYHPSRDTKRLEEEISRCNSILAETSGGAVEENPEEPGHVETYFEQDSDQSGVVGSEDPYVIDQPVLPADKIQQCLQQMRTGAGNVG